MSLRVLCDVCERDYTASFATGGFKYGPHFYCPSCAVAYVDDIEAFGDPKLIVARCRSTQRFADFVLTYARVAA